MSYVTSKTVVSPIAELEDRFDNLAAKLEETGQRLDRIEEMLRHLSLQIGFQQQTAPFVPALTLNPTTPTAAQEELRRYLEETLASIPPGVIDRRSYPPLGDSAAEEFMRERRGPYQVQPVDPRTYTSGIQTFPPQWAQYADVTVDAINARVSDTVNVTNSNEPG